MWKVYKSLGRYDSTVELPAQIAIIPLDLDNLNKFF